MAAVTLRDGLKFDSTAVFKHVEDFLPSYARPRFLRIQVCLLQLFYTFTNAFVGKPLCCHSDLFSPLIIGCTVIYYRGHWTLQARSS